MFNFQGPWSLKVGTLSRRVHPFPFRTRKLSSGEPKILCRQQHGKIGRRRHLASAFSAERKSMKREWSGCKTVLSQPKKEEKILRIFPEFIQVLFLPLISSSRSTKYTFGTRSRGLRLNPFAKTTPNGGVAQLGEHLPCKQGVMGSNPIISTRVDTAERSHGLVAQLVRAPA